MNLFKRLFAWLAPSSKTRRNSRPTVFARGTITVNGHARIIYCTPHNVGYFFRGLEKLATSCAGCGQPILPDEPVLSTTEGNERKLFGHCCTEMGLADCTGRWTIEGYKELSLTELCSASPSST